MTIFSLTEDSKSKTLAIFYESGDTECISDTHPSFKPIVDLWLSGEATDEEVSLLVNVMDTLEKRMVPLSERLSILNGTLFFDGDELRSELSTVIIELFSKGSSADYTPLVNFLEKTLTNVSSKSIDDLYRWITNGDLVITPTGDVIGYKGVAVFDGSDDIGWSTQQGTAWVDGVETTGFIPYKPGSVVTMPRSAVDDNSNKACSAGLHIGTYDFARCYGDKMTLVQFNPRDVVAVPTDSSGQKIRVCRLVVLDDTEGRLEERVVPTFVDDNYDTPVRDAKGRFTKEGAVKAKRDSKGRFIKTTINN